MSDHGEYDTLVIGAGAAGLAAARVLASAGQRVAVLEARERVGGRIFTQRTPAAGSGDILSIELGAEFIHGLPAETWDLVIEAGVETCELQGSHLSLADGHIQSCDASPDAASEVLAGLEQWTRERPGDDMTFAAYLEHAGVGAADAEAASAYVEGFNAADRTIIGIAALAKQQRAERQTQGDRIFHVRGGYDQLPRLLLGALERIGTPVWLNRTVRQLTWREGEVSVLVQDPANRTSSLRAHRAVITLPLGVLQSGCVKFSPEPGAVLAHAQSLRMGTVVRATLVFSSRFWRDGDLPIAHSASATELENLSFLFTPQLIPATWWTSMPESSPIITGWIGGPKAVLLQRRLGETAAPGSLLEVCLRSLSTAFGISEPALRRHLRSWHAHDWSSDPHALGAYSYAAAGALDASDKMTVPVAETLYFAGEHTDTTGHWGTVHGALRSGLRAAAQILTA